MDYQQFIQKAILRTIPHAVVGLRKRVVIFANEGVEKVFGWKPDELVGKSTRVLYQSRRAYIDAGRRAIPFLKDQSSYTIEVQCRSKDGKNIVCRLTGAPIAGFPGDVVAIYEDITDANRVLDALR